MGARKVSGKVDLSSDINGNEPAMLCSREEHSRERQHMRWAWEWDRDCYFLKVERRPVW